MCGALALGKQALGTCVRPSVVHGCARAHRSSDGYWHDFRGVVFPTPVATIGVRGTEFVGQISASDSTIALLDGKISVANEFSTQFVTNPGFGVTIDPVGLISAPVKLPVEQLDALVDAVSTRKEVLDNETADVPEARKEEDSEEEECTPLTLNSI